MPNSSRIIGLDAARTVAIIGMIIAHMASLVWTTKIILTGIPAAMFAVIAGTTMMLIGRNYSSVTFLKILVRGALIALIGIVLLPVGNQIQIVLIAMGITIIATSWIPALSIPWRIAIFTALTLASAFYYGNNTLPQVYPLLTWAAYFVGGMILYDVYIKHEKLNAKHRLTWCFTGVSLIISIVGFCLRFATGIPAWFRFNGHTGTLGEILLSIAVTAIILHILLFLGSKLQRLMMPFTAMGSMSLTTYTLHVLTANHWQSNVVAFSTISAFGFILFFLIFATLWQRFIGQGPLEMIVKYTINIVIPERKVVKNEDN